MQPLIVRLFLLCFVCCLHGVARDLTAESPPSAGDSQAASPGHALPDPAAAGFAPKAINSSNALEYQELIIPELYTMVRSGAVEFNAIKALKFEWEYDNEWTSNSRDYGMSITLDGGALGPQVSMKRGFPFGDIAKVSSEGDAVVQGQKILWNINALWWGAKILNLDFNLLKPGAAHADLRLGANLTRVYPRAIDAADKTPQLFRERLQFLEPKFINGLSWLTFRFFGHEEDALWVFSPAIQKTRELTGANRSDSLIKSSFSPDDLLGWSGNPDLVEARMDREMTVFVPFASLVPQPLAAAADSCDRIVLQDDKSEGGQGAQWNFESGKFPHAAPWLPTAVTFVPRSVVRIELTSRDPYSLYGRQILYVDTQSMLPVYKIVFDRAGRHWKTIIAAIALGVTSDQSRKIPLITLLTSSDVIRGQTWLIEFSQLSFCRALSERIKLADFDPHKLGGAAVEKAAATAVPSPQQVEEEEDER